MGNFVDCGDETTERCFERDKFRRRERAENVAHGLESTLADDGVPLATLGSDADRDYSTVRWKRAALGEIELFEALNRTRCSGRVDVEGIGEVAHPPALTLDKKIECVDLTRVERRLTLTEQLVTNR